MNTTMSYEQLDKLSKNPHYVMSKKEIELLEKYREERFVAKHPYSLNKHNPSIHKQIPKIEDPNGTS